MTRLIIGMVLALVGGITAHAEELVANQLYGAGTVVHAGAVGLTLTIPPGWQGALPPDSPVFVMGSDEAQANMFVITQPASEQEVLAEMSKPLTLANNVVLTPVAKPTAADGHIDNHYTISVNDALLGRARATVGTNGLGVMLVVIAEKSHIEKAWEGTKALSESLAFEKVVQQPAQAADAGNWSDYMRGRYIVRFYTTSGYREKEEIWLCSNGTFVRATESGGFGGGASLASQGNGNGEWRADGTLDGAGQLVLKYGPGASLTGSGPGFDWQEQGPGYETLTYTLSRDGDKLLLNGTRWLRDTNKLCE
ncbi:MAG: hypothetical protein KDI19_02140 [Pseudomonadales bacterium]|nr:hypothetical protein [Pseudomonadales bacterium]